MNEDAHSVAAMQEGVDLGVLDDLLDEVHGDVLREQAEEQTAAINVSTGEAASDEVDALSPDDMLRQLDAVTLPDDDDDEDDHDHAAAFEDAHEEPHAAAALVGDDEPVGNGVDELLFAQAACDTDNVDDVGVSTVDELADFHDPAGVSADGSGASTTDALSADATAAESAMRPAESDAVVNDEPLKAAEMTAVAVGGETIDKGNNKGDGEGDDSDDERAVGEDPVAAEAEATVPTARSEDERVAGAHGDALGGGDDESSANDSASQSSPQDPVVSVATDPADDSVESTPATAVISDSEDTSVSATQDILSDEHRAESESSERHRSPSDLDADAVVDPPPLIAPLRLDSEAVASDDDTTTSPTHRDLNAAADDGDDDNVASNEAEVPGDVFDAPVAETQKSELLEMDTHSGNVAAHNDSDGANSEHADVTLELPAPADQTDESPVLPPPAPATHPVVVGSMVPSADGDSDSDSQDEAGSEHSAPPSPLRLGADFGDDDGDELEVDPAVVETIEVEKQMRSSVVNAQTSAPAGADKDSALSAALPPPKFTADSAGAEEVDFSFSDEVRVAHVTMSPVDMVAPAPAPASKLSEPHSDDDASVAAAFGISYTSLKAKKPLHDGTVDSDAYALPMAPAFPDEREFENELALASDLVFSVKTTSAADQTDNDDDNDEDDEFGSVTPLAVDELSLDALDAKRASLQARETEAEASILEELKRATDAEKSLNGAASAIPVAGVQAQAQTPQAPPEPESTISLRELHGIYKRGLGDQSVLLLDGDDDNRASGSDSAASKTPSAPAATSSGIGKPLSVMGRILSKPSLISHVITEEEEDDGDDVADNDDGDDSALGGAHDPYRERETLIDTSAARESSDGRSSAAGDWKEIQLTAHGSVVRGDAKPSTSAAPDAGSSSQSDAVAAPAMTSNFRISYSEVLVHCQQADEFLLHRDAIVTEEFAENGRSCFACFSPRPRLTFPGALDERDRVFCVAATGYDPRSNVFVRTLQTLYAKLMRSPRAVPLSGSHWEDIGFQGNDPGTDLRGCGVLSLLQMLYLVDRHPELALRFHSLSTHPTRHFPLACVLINVTLQCVTALRSGALYRECNKQASVFGAINTFYVALATELMDELQSSSDDVPIIIKNVLEDGRGHPDRVINGFARTGALGAHQPQAQTQVTSPHRQSAASARGSGPNIEFTEIALQSTASDGED